MGKITIIEPGLFTSVQDRGRFGYSGWGIPVSGAMDQLSLLLANSILGNNPDAACLEITQFGPTLQFSDDTVVLFSGASAPVLLNNGPLPLTNLQWLPIKKGDQLNIGYLKNGLRSYMAIKGGFQIDPLFGSRSQSLGTTHLDRLIKHDVLIYNTPSNSFSLPSGRVKPTYPWLNKKHLQVYPGPEFTSLTEIEKEALLNSHFTLSRYSNRMAIQLEERLFNKAEQILTSPVFPGTVQLTPAGKLLILMREAQVTGGYPRILQVKDEELDLLAQLPLGSKFKFILIES
jgi:biotin-dependent carboxylase-like uncharacterized protein